MADTAAAANAAGRSSGGGNGVVIEAEKAAEGPPGDVLQWAEGVALTAAAARDALSTSSSVPSSRRLTARASGGNADATAAETAFTITGSKDGGGIRLQRLQTRYNADVGLFLLNSRRWMVPAESIHVMCETRGQAG